MSEGTIAQVLAGEATWCVSDGDNRDVLPSLPDRSVHHCIVDPPYSKEVHSRSIRRTYLPDVAEQPCRKTRAFAFGFDHITPEEQTFCAKHFARVATRWSLVFSDTETAASWRTEMTGAGLDFIRFGFWVKDRAMPQISGDRPGSRVEQITIAHPKGRKKWNGGGLGNVWQHPVVANCSGHRSDRVHPAQKPESLMLELVGLFTSPGDIVLDCYAGSGSTGVAALRLGRRFIGVERLAEHAKTARERLLAEDSSSTLQAIRSGQGALFT